MKLLTKGWATLAALVAGGLLAASAGPALAAKAAATLPGRMAVTDEAALFSAEARGKAEQRMSAAKFDRGLHFHVDTHKTLPSDVKREYDAAGDKAAVMKRWAKSIASGDKAKGPYVLICLNPGWTVVLIDEETVNRGFGKGEEDHIRVLFDNAMKEAAKHPPGVERVKVRDVALLAATDYVINDLKGTKVVHTDGTPMKDGKTTAATTTPAKKAGMSIGGWICLGLVVLLAIWLVVGIIRALTAPSYGGGGYGGGGGGFGGGGGGFGTALLGGMFGAMAGMWMYNSMMGTHYPPQAFGGDASAAGDTGGADTGDTGAGDYSDGSSGASGGDYGGGDYGGGGGDGGGDYGGGDYGGGGGDYGGGGDFGGGGGGDYGGGGDF